MSVQKLDIAASHLCTESLSAKIGYEIASLFGLIKCHVCGRYLSTFYDTCSDKFLYFSPEFVLRDETLKNQHKFIGTRLLYSDSIALYAYTKSIKSLFAVYKYKRAYQYQRVIEYLFAEYMCVDPFLLYEKLKQLCRNKKVAIVPVPMTKKKREDRGFSPAFELSIMLGRFLYPHAKVTLFTSLLNKKTDTKAQAKKHRRERLVSLQNAYELNTSGIPAFLEYSPQALIVVDDVLTTGATTTVIIEKLQADMALKNYLSAIPVIRFTFAAA